MSEVSPQVTGHLLQAGTAWLFLAIWVVAVLVHAFRRSGGEAPLDPIRSSGPVL